MNCKPTLLLLIALTSLTGCSQEQEQPREPVTPTGGAGAPPGEVGGGDRNPGAGGVPVGDGPASHTPPYTPDYPSP